jgi:hypothetical protein
MNVLRKLTSKYPGNHGINPVFLLREPQYSFGKPGRSYGKTSCRTPSGRPVYTRKRGTLAAPPPFQPCSDLPSGNKYSGLTRQLSHSDLTAVHPRRNCSERKLHRLQAGSGYLSLSREDGTAGKIRQPQGNV